MFPGKLRHVNQAVHSAEGNYIGHIDYSLDFTPETEAQAAWAEYVAEHGLELPASGGKPEDEFAESAQVDDTLAANSGSSESGDD